MKKTVILYYCDLCGTKGEGGGDRWLPIDWTEVKVQLHEDFRPEKTYGDVEVKHICPRCRTIIAKAKSQRE